MDNIVTIEGLPIVQFVRINNRKNFLLGDIPKIHPEAMEYVRYYRTQKKRCIEGYWGPDDADITVDVSKPLPEDVDSSKWRWMPPNLYFYVNLGTILHNVEGAPKTAPKKRIRPYLRDVEWEFFYNFTEARGFSGFTGDKEYTCLTRVTEDDFSLGEYKLECYDENGIFLETKWHNAVKEDNKTLKEYVPARTYIRKLHSSKLGLPIYENQARNLFMLGSRGFGKSYMVGVGVVLYEILFDGARYYTQESIENPYKVEVFVGAALSSKSADILDKTKTALECLPGEWGEGDDYTPSPFFKQMSGSLRPNNMKNPWIHSYEKKVGGAWKKFGTSSNVKHGVYTVENPEAAAGTRPGIMIVEEVGLCPNILTVHGSNTACMMEGTTKFGTAVYLGTGGNIEKVEQSKIIFYDPKGFEFLEHENPESPGTKIGWFVPAIYGINQYKDSNGNTDLQRAIERKLKDRADKQTSKDPSAIDLEMMNYPLVPSEMFLNKNGNIFPIAYLNDRLADLETDDKYINAEYHGRLKINDSERVEWVLDDKCKPIYSYPLTQDDRNKGRDKGNIVIYEHPFSDVNGDTPYGRYIAGCDPYDHDQAGTTSLGSVIVYDRLTKLVVAEYTGRPDSAKTYYEEVRKLMMYYNAKLLYENERKGIFDYFESMNSLYLLKEQPAIIKDVVQNSKVERGYGMHMNKPLKIYGEQLIKEWLTESFNDKQGSAVLNLHKLRCIPLVKELINYNNTGNFDRAMAFMILMYHIADIRKQTIIDRSQPDYKDIRNDPFFNRPTFRKKAFKL